MQHYYGLKMVSALLYLLCAPVSSQYMGSCWYYSILRPPLVCNERRDSGVSLSWSGTPHMGVCPNIEFNIGVAILNADTSSARHPRWCLWCMVCLCRYWFSSRSWLYLRFYLDLGAQRLAHHRHNGETTLSMCFLLLHFYFALLFANG